ncbi:hypothetical protein [Flavobacterium sp. 14A]|uniref:hypothetical protein n=1 Tax=Flavobacterium sp. 14A TaxID=2735896 RepID=UPI001C2CE5C1|nr:hypothetical protein [Flavobacterium sp. 14A]NRT11831.1 hypothetical protein [Flavobacterium sp. 14A]
MYSQGDGSRTLRGRIMVDSDYIGQVNIVNQTLNLSTTSNEVGQFNIAVKEGDLLVFTAVNLVTLRKYISKEDFLSGSILVEAKYNSIALDEVVIKESSITAESLGIIPVGQKKYTQAERKLYTATSGGGIDGLLNAMSGRKTMLKKVVVIEKKQAAYDRLIYIFEDDFYTDKLKIATDYISGFQYYCVEDDEFVAAIDSKNKTLIKFLIVILAEKYKKINTDENVN